MTTEASIARRTAKLAEQIGAGDGAGGILLVGRGMRSIREGIERAKILRDGTAPRPEPGGMRAFRAEVVRCKNMIEARELAEPSEPEERITPLPRPVLPPTPAPQPAASLRPARPPSRPPAPTPKAAPKPAAKYSWEDL